MRKSYLAAHIYMVVGLVSGIFYREFTKLNHFTGKTQMSIVHTHVLALGMFGFLIVLALDKLFELSAAKQFTWFFWFYNAGMAITVIAMETRGIATVLGNELPEALSWFAGAGHILMTIGLVMLLTLLGKRVGHTPKA